MENNELNYIPFGKQLEKRHEVISKWKAILFCILFLAITFQVIYFLSNGRYFQLSNTTNRYLFLEIIAGLFAILLCLYSYLTVKFKRGRKVFLYFILSIIALAVVIAFLPLNKDFNTLKFLLAIVCNTAIAFTIHLITFYSVSSIFLGYKLKPHTKVESSEMVRFDLKSLCILLSPDYFFAKVFKGILKSETYDRNPTDPNDYQTLQGEKLGRIREQRNRLRYFIVFSNWLNVMFTFVVGLLLLFVNIYDNSIIDEWWFEFIFYLTLLRLISRSFEIVYAFFKDVVRNKVVYIYKNDERNNITKDRLINNWKGSSIRRPERISLAAHSYLEILLLFAICYFLILGTTQNNPCELYQFKNYNDHQTLSNLCTNNPNMVNANKVNINGFFDTVLYSASVTFFNVSFDYTNLTPLIWKIVHASQVLVSIILIVLSLASYISLPDKLEDDEIKEFLLIKYFDGKDIGEYKKMYEKIETKGIDKK